MLETHHVIITSGALSDLEEIASYIRQHSEENAVRVAQSIIDGIDSLASMPRRFKRVGISRKNRSSIHALVVRPFVIYYRVEQTPAVVYVLHSTRKASGARSTGIAFTRRQVIPGSCYIPRRKAADGVSVPRSDAQGRKRTCYFHRHPPPDPLAFVVETMRELSRQTDPEAMVQTYGSRVRTVMGTDGMIALSRRDLRLTSTASPAAGCGVIRSTHGRSVTGSRSTAAASWAG